MDGLAGWTISLIQSDGYSGLGLCLLLNSLGVPFPSEVLLPFAGLAVQQGHMEMTTVLVVSVAAQMVGLLASYLLVRLWFERKGQRRGNRVTKSAQVVRLRKIFAERGSWVVLGAICLPGLHGLAGYAAGLAKMSLWRFGALAMAGTLLWTVGLVWLGHLAGSHIQEIYSAFHSLGLVTVGVIGAAALIWYSRHHEN